MWSYKRGDNIVYNYRVLWELYRVRVGMPPYQATLYNKPIILTMASIIECILYDFATRITQHVNDVVPNMSATVIEDFKTTQRDKFNHHIVAAQRHNLFDANSFFYDELMFVMRSRNRFHIQNSYGHAPSDEHILFTNQSVKRVELVFEYLIKKMMKKFYRGDGPRVKPAALPLPWKEPAN